MHANEAIGQAECMRIGIRLLVVLAGRTAQAACTRRCRRCRPGPAVRPRCSGRCPDRSARRKRCGWFGERQRASAPRRVPPAWPCGGISRLYTSRGIVWSRQTPISSPSSTHASSDQGCSTFSSSRRLPVEVLSSQTAGIAIVPSVAAPAAIQARPGQVPGTNV